MSKTSLRYHVTAHPIDRAHQERLRIYESGYVKSVSLGRILKSLVEAGHTDIQSYVEDNVMHIHCKKPRR